MKSDDFVSFKEHSHIVSLFQRTPWSPQSRYWRCQDKWHSSSSWFLPKSQVRLRDWQRNIKRLGLDWDIWTSEGWWGPAHTDRDLWNSPFLVLFIHQNQDSVVLLGADSKVWPMPKLGLRNIYFSQASQARPTHFLVLAFIPFERPCPPEQELRGIFQ